MSPTIPVRALVLATLVTLAGCSVVNPGTSAVESATPTDTWDGDPDNPYRKSTLVVGLENGANESRDFAPMVRSALDYWEGASDTYAGFPIAYRLRPDADDPDILVRIVDEVDCGEEDHAAGCADVIDEPGQFRPPVGVRVLGGLSDASTVDVLKHEFGHTLGLTHTDEPQAVMAAERNLTTLPRPDATDRALPWNDSELTVYLDISNLSASERDEARRQVRAAVGYFADGAEGTVPDNVTFDFTDNRSAAEVTVVAVEDLSCQSGAGSCGSIQGTDPDGDGALETYTRLRITFAGLDTDVVAWHVGRWLGRGFGFETEAEYPPPLREDASYHERRSEWWE